MAIVHVTSHLQQVAPKEKRQFNGTDLRQVLDGLFQEFPLLRGYVLDDRGAIRKHVAIFIDGDRISTLNLSVRPETEIHILQALSGG